MILHLIIEISEDSAHYNQIYRVDFEKECGYKNYRTHYYAFKPDEILLIHHKHSGRKNQSDDDGIERRQQHFDVVVLFVLEQPRDYYCH